MCSICAGIGQSTIPSLTQMAYFGLVKLSGALVLILVVGKNFFKTAIVKKKFKKK
jgi:hypothetical protein